MIYDFGELLDSSQKTSSHSVGKVIKKRRQSRAGLQNGLQLLPISNNVVSGGLDLNLSGYVLNYEIVQTCYFINISPIFTSSRLKKVIKTFSPCAALCFTQ